MIFDANSIASENLGPFCERRVLPQTERLMAVEVRFKKDGIGAIHAHADHDQVSYVLSGSFEVTVGEETRIVGAGGGFSVERNVAHGVRALEDGALLDCFTPIRDDFLK